MDAQLTVRLPREQLDLLHREAEQMGLKTSDIVRMALMRHLDEAASAGTRPYDRVKRLVGSLSSGVSDLGERHREHIISQLRST